MKGSAIGSAGVDVDLPVRQRMEIETQRGETVKFISGDRPIPSSGIASDREKALPEFRRAYSGKRCVLSVAGEIRHGNTERLTDEAMDLFRSDVSDLLLDLRSVGYCDTAGLESLVLIHKYVERNPHLSFTIFVPEGALLKTLLICRFDRFMNITQDESVFEGDWQPA